MWLVLVLTRSASACTMYALPDTPALPGPIAGPEAVFGSEDTGVRLLGPDDAEIAVSRLALGDIAGLRELLTPEAPLAAGVYHLETCQGDCTVSIEEGQGDPGVPPEPPGVTEDTVWEYTGQRADCGPRRRTTYLLAETAAPALVYATSPVDTLDDPAVLGVIRPDLGWELERGDEVYVAALDAEGELSTWEGPFARGCTTSGSPMAWLAGLAAVGLRRPRPAPAQPSRRRAQSAAHASIPRTPTASSTSAL